MFFTKDACSMLVIIRDIFGRFIVKKSTSSRKREIMLNLQFMRILLKQVGEKITFAIIDIYSLKKIFL